MLRLALVLYICRQHIQEACVAGRRIQFPPGNLTHGGPVSVEPAGVYQRAQSTLHRVRGHAEMLCRFGIKTLGDKAYALMLAYKLVYHINRVVVRGKLLNA